MNAAHILIAEDEEVTRRRLESVMASEGYLVTSVGSALAALGEIEERRPDLLILDLTLYDDDPFSGIHDGLALLTLIRRIDPQGSFPVIIYTADDSPNVRTRAEALGVFAVLSKERSLDELQETVRAALGGQNNEATAA